MVFCSLVGFLRVCYYCSGLGVCGPLQAGPGSTPIYSQGKSDFHHFIYPFLTYQPITSPASSVGRAPPCIYTPPMPPLPYPPSTSSPLPTHFPLDLPHFPQPQTPEQYTDISTLAPMCGKGTCMWRARVGRVALLCTLGRGRRFESCAGRNFLDLPKSETLPESSPNLYNMWSRVHMLCIYTIFCSSIERVESGTYQHRNLIPLTS